MTGPLSWLGGDAPAPPAVEQQHPPAAPTQPHFTLSVSASDLPVILGALEDRVKEDLKLADDIRGILSDDQVAHWQGEARKTAALIEDLVGQAWPGVPQTPEIWIAADLLAKLAEGSS